MPRSSIRKLLATRGRRICCTCAVQELSAPLLAMSSRRRNHECRALQGEGGSPGSMCCPLCAAAGDCCEELAISVATTISNLMLRSNPCVCGGGVSATQGDERKQEKKKQNNNSIIVRHESFFGWLGVGDELARCGPIQAAAAYPMSRVCKWGAPGIEEGRWPG